MLICFRNNETEELIFDAEEKYVLPREGDFVTLGLYGKIMYKVTNVQFNYSGRKLVRVTIYVDGPYDNTREERSARRYISV